MAAAGPLKAFAPVQEMVKKGGKPPLPPPPKAHEAAVPPALDKSYSKLGKAGGPRKIDYFYLMEKYGPKRSFLKNNTEPDEEKEPDPVGFMIRFKLSDAYKAIEKQEVEASAPKLKPYKQRKRRAHMLLLQKAQQVNNEMAGDSIGEIPAPGDDRGRKQQALQRLKFQNQEKLIWKNLTRTKASEAVQKKEMEQRKQARKGDQSPTLDRRKSKDASPVNGKSKGAPDIRPMSGKDKVKFEDEIGMTRKERIRLRKESENKIPGTKLFRTIMQHGGFGGESLKSETNTSMTYGSSQAGSLDTMMKFVTGGSSSSLVTVESISNVTEDHAVDVEHKPRPSSAKITAQLRQPRPRSSLSSRSSSPKQSHDSNSSKMETYTIRDEYKDADGETRQRRSSRKVSKYLYQMCNCRQVARPDTLDKLYRKKKNVSMFGSMLLIFWRK